MSVVISSAYVLPAGDDYSANSPAALVNNKVTTGNIVASGATQVGFPITNVANPATDIVWKGNTVSAAQTITVTPGGGDVIDAVGIAGHNLNSANITVKIQGNTGAGYSDRTSPMIPPNDGPVLFLLAAGLSWTGLRVHLTVGTTKPEIAVIKMGRLLRFQRRIYVGHTPITYGRSLDRVTGRGLNGAYLGSVVRGESVETNIAIKNMDPGWYRDYMDPFLVELKTSAFFWAWRPNSYPNEVGYCSIPPGRMPQPVNQLSNGMMEINFNVEGAV